jgi:hypothetical protein
MESHQLTKADKDQSKHDNEPVESSEFSDSFDIAMMHNNKISTTFNVLEDYFPDTDQNSSEATLNSCCKHANCVTNFLPKFSYDTDKLSYSFVTELSEVVSRMAINQNYEVSELPQENLDFEY